jgi:hypothetical protein
MSILQDKLNRKPVKDLPINEDVVVEDALPHMIPHTNFSARKVTENGICDIHESADVRDELSAMRDSADSLTGYVHASHVHTRMLLHIFDAQFESRCFR